MARLDRRKFLQMVGMGSAVALLPRVPHAAVEEEVLSFDFDYDTNPKGDFTVEFTVTFNDNLQNDPDARFVLFYADEFDKDGNPIMVAEGSIEGRSEIKLRVEPEKEVVCRALGLQVAQFCEGRMFVQEKPTMNMIAAVERNFEN